MRTRSIMLVALALGCGAVAAMGISQVMDANLKVADDGDRQPVFVAMADIRPNEELTAQNVKLEEWPKKIIPQGALTKLEEVEGKRTRLKLYAGEPILASKLLGADDMTGAAKDIPPGFRVAHVKVDSVSGSSNLILPGDRVDVLVFKNPNNDAQATAAKIVLQDIKVFAVDTQTETAFTATRDEQSEPMSAKSISLLVTPQQAVVLHAASEIGGAVRLVLRNPEDDAHVADEGATIGDIFGDEHKQADRMAEKGTPEKETADVSDWLTQESSKAGAARPTSPVPSAPPLPHAPKRMLVMMGAELVNIEIPGDGELPSMQFEQGPGDLGGNGPDPTMNEPPGGFSPVPPGGDQQLDESSDEEAGDEGQASS
jgi:pilus assembly protein CpaB